MKRIFRDSILLLLLLVTATAGAQNVEQQLRTFDDHADVTAANLFFAELQKADFLDEPIVFSASDLYTILRITKIITQVSRFPQLSA